jgi:integrase
MQCLLASEGPPAYFPTLGMRENGARDEVPAAAEQLPGSNEEISLVSDVQEHELEAESGVDAPSNVVEKEEATAEATAIVVDEPGFSPLVPPSDGRQPLPNPVRMYLASFTSDQSRRAMRDCLQRIVRLMGKWNGDRERYMRLAWWQLDASQTTEIRRLLVANVSPATVKLSLACLRGVLRACWRLGYIDGDRFARVTAWQRVEGGDERVAGRMLSTEELARVRAAYASEGAFLGALDGAIFELGVGGGLRRDEIARLELTDLTDDCKSLRVLGKRRKIRHQPLPDHTAGALKCWLAQRARFPFGSARLLIPVVGGRAEDRAMTAKGVWERMRELGRLAKVKFSPHDLRRTYISTALDVTDLATAQKLAGHADPRTTVRYDRRPEAVRRDAATKIGDALAPSAAGTLRRRERDE